MEEQQQEERYLQVRLWASGVSCLVLTVFNLLINGTIAREPRLRRHARFVLLLQLLLSALLYFSLCFTFYLQLHLRAAPGASTCAALVRALMTCGSGIILSITAMALDRYLAVCRPLLYRACCRGVWPWLAGLLTWALAAVLPHTVRVAAAGNVTRGCGSRALRGGGATHRMALLCACAALILYTYARVLCEGRRLGVMTRRNRAARRTVALHGLQLAVYILPSLVSFALQRTLAPGDTREMFAAVNFAFFSLAQCAAPAVYGLRKEELRERLRVRVRVPCVSGGRARAQGGAGQRGEQRLTSETLLSREISTTAV